MKQQCPACDRPAKVEKRMGDPFARIYCPIGKDLANDGSVRFYGCGRIEWPLNLPVRCNATDRERVSRGLREIQKDRAAGTYLRVTPELVESLQNREQ